MNDDRRHLIDGIDRLRSRVDPPRLPKIRRRIYEPAAEPGGEPVACELIEMDSSTGVYWELQENSDGTTTRVRHADLSGTKTKKHD